MRVLKRFKETEIWEGMQMKRLLLVGILLLVVIVFGQMLLPKFFESIIGGAMQTATNAQEVEVRVEKEPALSMLTGDFDLIDINAYQAEAGRVRLDEFAISLKGVHINLGDLISKRSLSMKSADDITMRAVITEAELNKTLNQGVKGISNAKVNIMPDDVTITGDMSVGGMLNASIVVHGEIIASDNAIVFHTEDVQLKNGLVGKIGGKLLTDIVLVDLKKLPFDVTVKNIALEQEMATIYADSHH